MITKACGLVLLAGSAYSAGQQGVPILIAIVSVAAGATLALILKRWS